jgi:PKD repeat protein
MIVFMTVSTAFGDVLPAGPPDSGIWYITGDEVLENGTFHINDSWVVMDGASLTVRNCTLILPNLSHGRLEVNSSGNLSICDSTLQCNDSVGEIGINGHADFLQCNITKIMIVYGSEQSNGNITNCILNSFNTCVYTFGDEVWIMNCTFIETGGSIYIWGGKVGIIGCRFLDTSSYTNTFQETQYSVQQLQPGIKVEENQFINKYVGITVGDYTPGGGGDIEGIANGQYTALISHNTFYDAPDYSIGVGIWFYNFNTDLEITNNSLVHCEDGLYLSENSNTNILVSNNSLDRGSYGIFIRNGSPIIANNSITNYTSYGIGSHDNPTAPNILHINGNRITNCSTGVSLSGTDSEFSYNFLADCPSCGASVTLIPIQPFYSSTLILNNTFMKCGLDPSGLGLRCAIFAETEPSSTMRISGNILINNSRTGLWIIGNVQADNNSIEGSKTGISVESRDIISELTMNRITGGETGIQLYSAALVDENDISGIEIGINLSFTTGPSASVVFSANSIYASRIGIFIHDYSSNMAPATILGNVIASGGDGILTDMASANITGNDFGGTSGYCVHAIGKAADLGTNDWGYMCAGRLLQEWYLVMSARESADPYGGGQWTRSTRFSAVVASPSGARVFEGSSGDSTSIRTGLTGFTIDRDGTKVQIGWYNITLLKPHTGVGFGQAVLLDNTVFMQDLWPRADLAVEDIALGAGRPQPGQMVPVMVTIVEDNSYDIAFMPFHGVLVSLSNGDILIGERTLEAIQPNSTAMVNFSWFAESGLHTLTAMVDPNQFLAEAFEDNNALSTTVSVNSPPVPVLDISDPNPVVGQTVVFFSNRSTDDVGVARSLFDFGDGTDSGWTGDSLVRHTYGRAGYCYARLMVMDGDGATGDWSSVQDVRVSPGAFGVSLVANASVLDTLVPVTLTALVDGDYGARTRYLWDFGDGTSETGVNASQVEHVFSRAGSFTVWTSVTGETGGNGTASCVLTVRDRPPVADFDFTPAAPTVLTPVRFSSVSGDPDGVIVKWQWSFGDGKQSAEPSPAHLYTAHGNFTVTLTVEDDSGSWAVVAAKQVGVLDLPPAAHARASALAVHAGDTVRLDASLTVDPDDPPSALAFRWSASDGWSSEGESAARQFARSGKFILTLTVVDGNGASSQDTLSITVIEQGKPDAFQYRPVAVALFAVAAALFAGSAFLWNAERAWRKNDR